MHAQVYGAVTMNNTMCLGLFLLVMHTRQLPWTYSSEVLVTVGTLSGSVHACAVKLSARMSTSYIRNCKHKVFAS